VSDTSGVTFQWAFNGTAIGGATGDSLLLPSVAAANAGQYSVTVTNSAGTVTSSPATLALDSGTSTPSPLPRLTAYSDPGGSVTVTPFQRDYALGEPVTLTAVPTAPSVFVGWSGISTGDLLATTSPVTVTMTADTTVRARFASPVPLAEGMVAFWRGETDATDLIGGHSGTFFTGSTPTAPSITEWGKVGSAFAFTGTNYVRIPDAPGLQPPQITLEAWVFPTVLSSTSYQTVIGRGSSTAVAEQWWLGVLNGIPQFFTHSSALLKGPAAIPLNQWTHLAATFDGATKVLYVNGIPVGSQGGLGALAYAPVPVGIGTTWQENAPTDLFTGFIDEVSLYDRALTFDEVFDIYNADIAGKDVTAPYFTTNSPLPAAAVNDTGYTQQLTTVLGTAPVTFALSAGALPPGMTLSPAGAVSGASAVPGVFDVTVTATDASGNSTDQLYVLTIGPPVVPPAPGPQITTGPVLAAAVGRAYTQAFTSTGGTPPVSYTLAEASTAPPGLTLSPAGVLSGTPTAAGGFAFTVVATDAAGLFDEQPCTLRAYQSVPAPAGMLGWWKAEGNALDSAGTNNGALTGGAGYAAGEVGQAFSLDGSTGYVQIPDAPALQPVSLTVEAWVLLDSTSGLRVVFAKPLGSGTNDSYVLWLSSGILNGAVCDATGCTYVSAPSPPLTTGTWYHVAHTVDSSAKQQVLYVDGVQVASAATTLSPSYDTQALFLGRDTDNTQAASFLNGLIDEASIYNRALTPAEIASIYNAGPAGKEPVAPPVVTGVSPASGLTAGGETVTVTGSGFTNATGVSFGTATTTNLTVTSDTQLTVPSPAATTSGTVNVTVTTPAGTSSTSAATQFTYSNG
jgi:Concanavalin A-like lectin/glucanases superfamily/IPT/TIG domain/Divergent InlB B-repeat domain/Putative Ig domain